MVVWYYEKICIESVQIISGALVSKQHLTAFENYLPVVVVHFYSENDAITTTLKKEIPMHRLVLVSVSRNGHLYEV